MIFVSKLLTVLFLPPGCIILFLIIMMFFVRWKIKIFLGMLLVFFYAFSIQPVSDFLLKPLENAWPPLSEHIDKDWPQAIVVLGGGTVQGSPEAGEGHDTLSSDTYKRAVYALTLCDTFPVPLIFTGGRVFDIIRNRKLLRQEGSLNLLVLTAAVLFLKQQAGTHGRTRGRL